MESRSGNTTKALCGPNHPSDVIPPSRALWGDSGYPALGATPDLSANTSHTWRKYDLSGSISKISVKVIVVCSQIPVTIILLPFSSKRTIEIGNIQYRVA